jgi:predicted transposase YbfD/YdcC
MTFLALEHGIPSHDTFSRVLQMLDPRKFHDCFVRWVRALHETTRGQVVPIDGKTLRRSFDSAAGLPPLHLVSAWAAENRLVLGAVPVDGKSNEITAVPKLLEVLELTGAIVTLDAMGCQKEIAGKIREKKADYVLAVKDNQPHLRDDLPASSTRCSRMSRRCRRVSGTGRSRRAVGGSRSGSITRSRSPRPCATARPGAT